MNCLVLYNNSYPKGMAMANRLKLYAEAVALEGHKFVVLPKLSNGSITPETKFENHFYYTINTNSIFDRIPFFNRFFGWYSFLLYLIHLGKKKNEYDVYWSIGFSWLEVILFKVVLKTTNKPLIVELNEFPNSVIASRLQFNFINNIKRFLLVHLAYPKLDGFVVISEKLHEFADKYKSAKAKIIKIPILVDVNKFDLSDNTIEKRFEQFIIFHAGTLTEEKDGIFEVFEAIGKVVSTKFPQLKFVLSNKTTLPHVINGIDKIIEKYNMKDNIVFHNYLTNEEIHNYLKTCSLVIINKPDTLRNSYNFSTKLGECMGFGIPIITTPVGEANKYLKDNVNVYIINSTNVEQIVSRIIDVFENKSKSIEMGNNAYQTSKDFFDYTNYGNKLVSFFKSLNEV
jgi:glycosyltransferase involved in cell wall biosynthesis